LGAKVNFVAAVLELLGDESRTPQMAAAWVRASHDGPSTDNRSIEVASPWERGSETTLVGCDDTMMEDSWSEEVRLSRRPRRDAAHVDGGEWLKPVGTMPLG
jgi:hypothetical protein